MLLEAHIHCVVCMYLLNITFIQYYLSLIPFMVLRHFPLLALVTVLPCFASFYNTYLLAQHFTIGSCSFQSLMSYTYFVGRSGKENAVK